MADNYTCGYFVFFICIGVGCACCGFLGHLYDGVPRIEGNFVAIDEEIRMNTTAC